MLNIRPHRRLSAIGFAIRIGEWSAPICPAVRKIFCMLCFCSYRFTLAPIRRVTVHASLFAVEQGAEHLTNMNVRAGGCNRVDDALSAVDADVSFQPKIPLVSGIRCNATIKALVHAASRNGKASQVALVACMRKLLAILNAIAASGTSWTAPKRAGIAS